MKHTFRGRTVALLVPVVFGIVSASALGAQGQSPAPSAAAARLGFEVASVKVAVPRPAPGGGSGERTGGGGCRQSLKMDQGRVDIECATLVTLIGYAYGFSPERVTGPDWMMGLGATRFNIAAKLPQGASGRQVPEMVQSFLADRFQLVLHRGSSERATYVLVVAKGGLKVREAAPESGTPGAAAGSNGPPVPIDFFGGVETRMTPNDDGNGLTTTISSPRMGTVRETDGANGIQRWEAAGISLEGLAELLDKVAPLSLPTIDMTGLNGRYRVVLEVAQKDFFGPRAAMPAPDAAARENARMDFEDLVVRALNDGLRKLGLQLERRRAAVGTLVVDHVEKMPTEN